jgi:hypothetical protein
VWIVEMEKSSRRSRRMAGKKKIGLEKNEFLYTGRKFQVPIPEINLDNLKKSHHTDGKVLNFSFKCLC